MTLAAWALGVAGLLASAPSARAEYYEYTTTVTIDTASGVTPAGSTITNNSSNASFTTALGNQIILTGQDSANSGMHSNAQGFGSTAPVLLIQAVAGSTLENPVGFNFRVDVNIQNFTTPDAASPNATGLFTFTGRLEGPLGAGQSDIKFLNFATPNGPSVTIDGESYSFSLQGYSAPGTDLNTRGGLTLRVIARPVPEPGSLALMGMGGVGALGMFLRRRARATA
jgi:hypothetical protein